MIRFGCFGGSGASDVPRPSAATANGRCILQNTFMPMCLRTLPINEYVEKQWSEYEINYNYYISSTQKIIDSINRYNQLTLF